MLDPEDWRTNADRDGGRAGEYAPPRKEYRYWSSDERFSDLVDHLSPLQFGGWSMGEVADALSTVGWKPCPLDPPRVRDPALWRKQVVDWELAPGPRAGLATVMMSNADPMRAVKLTVNLSHGIDFDMDYADGPDYAEVAFIRSAWSMLANDLGAEATCWSGHGAVPAGRYGPGVRMVWERPETTWSLRLDSDQVVLELIRVDSDGVERQEPHPVWCAVNWAVPPSDHEPDSIADWDDVRTRTHTALSALCVDVPTLPARFQVRLRSASDPDRAVTVCNEDSGLWLEVPATLGDTAVARRAVREWTKHGGVWRLRFGETGVEPGHIAAATEQLAATLIALGVTPSDLRYHGHLDARHRTLRLDLPQLGIDRDNQP
ncbi:hypothetical protein [Nocardia pseudobrasiliensis]|uniref:hypothetical protein n=1 Tax=Nocardia pseudobrasiliensis TaxID=45979 RepID=UPI0011C070FC|nr:hypothetical protein [Nocardia pseudobrasiliensis]